MPPDTDDYDRGLLFDFVSYIVVLFSKGRPRHDYAAFAGISRADWDRYAAELDAQRERLLAATADHDRLIAEIQQRARAELERAQPAPAASEPELASIL